MSNQEIVRLGDPTRIQQKGQPKKPNKTNPNGGAAQLGSS